MPLIAATIVMLAVAAGALIVNAVVQRQTDLDNGTVWIVSQRDGGIGRLNVRARQLEAVVDVPEDRFDVQQRDDAAAIVSASGIASIDPVTLSVAAATRIAPSATVASGGGTLAAIDDATGRVWVADERTPQSLSAESSSPCMTLGAHGLLAVDFDGRAYGYRPDDGMVIVCDRQRSDALAIGSLTGGARTVADSFTVVHGIPVIATSGSVRWLANGNARNASLGSPHADARWRLQHPPTDRVQQDWVMLSADGALAAVDFGSGRALLHDARGSGTAATPVSASGCAHAAWARIERNYARLCSFEEAARTSDPFTTLRSMPLNAQPSFRVNHRLVVLNDANAGAIWIPDDDADAIAVDWQSTTMNESDDGDADSRQTSEHAQLRASCAAQSEPIEAQDDDFGIRAGSTRMIDVLRNDRQSDCSALRIIRAGLSSSHPIGVDIAADGRYVQIDATQAAAGNATLAYTIDDGRGQTSTASVTLRVTDATADAAPQQRGQPDVFRVEQGATLLVHALAGFDDPDGDPITLVGARVLNADRASASVRADGQLSFSAGASDPGTVSVELTVSDGRNRATGAIGIVVHPRGSLPADIDPLAVRATPNADVVVHVGRAVRSTSETAPTLQSVDPPEGATVVMDAEAMTFSFRSPAVGTHYVPYVIVQGTREAQGLARIDVTAPATVSEPPIVADDVSVLGADLTAIIEPLGNDIDPSGGVLAVSDAQAPYDSGLRIGVEGSRRIHVAAQRAPQQPLTLTYEAANAVGVATGTIVLHPPSDSSRPSTLHAGDVTAHVRTGGIVSVDALSHVASSGSDAVRLSNDLRVDAERFQGLAFASGSTVRYQAGADAGTFAIGYTAIDGAGNTDSGTITVIVHAADAASKPAPTPRSLEAQVAAGDTVRIDIPLSGIDPDGDTVVLSGLGSARPRLGRITEADATGMRYEAYPDSSGTDEFSYAVEDWTGQRAQATIRVGVFTPRTVAQPGLHARNDAVTLRPGTAASVPVTSNDIAPGNAAPTLDDRIESADIPDAVPHDGMIRFTVPSEPGTFSIAYAIRDEAGRRDTATLTVIADPQAPIEPPEASDCHVEAASTIDRASVAVDLSPWIANPSGSGEDLAVSVHASAAGIARLAPGSRSTITVDLGDEPRAVPYVVTNVAHGLVSMAFVHVPALGAFPPTLRPKAPRLVVNAGDTLTIPLADHVRVGAGKTATIASPDSVSATKAADDDYVIDDATLRFRALDDYAGPASITVTVTDAIDAHDTRSAASTATLTLPITVVGRSAMPPTFRAGVIDVAAGEREQTIALRAFTQAPQESSLEPSGSDRAEAAYVYESPGASGAVSAAVDRDGTLTISAAPDAAAGTMTSIPLTIRYEGGSLDAGIMARVVSSSRPLAHIADVELTIRAGESASVRVTDGAYNPFPDLPLSIEDVSVSEPDALHAQWSGDGTVTLAVPEGTTARTMAASVTVSDGTHAVDRQISGTITVSVVDRPAAPVLSPEPKRMDGALEVTFAPGSANGSPIEEYRIDYESGSASCGIATVCTVSGLANGRVYRMVARARNAVGWSDPSNAVDGQPDVAPGQVRAVALSAGLQSADVSWQPPAEAGTPPSRYDVTLRGTNGFVETASTATTSHRFAIPRTAIADGAQFTATVVAVNQVGAGAPSAPSNAAAPWSSPDEPTVTLSHQPDGLVIAVAIALGDLRNAGCSSIELTGGVRRTLACPGGGEQAHAPRTATAQFDIVPQDFGSTVSLEVRVIPSSDAAPAVASAQITPVYAIKEPADVRIEGAGSQCIVHWMQQGYADGFEARVDGVGSMHAQSGDTSAAFALRPWQRCGTGSVTQQLNGSSGPPVQADGSYVYKVAAAIDARMQVRWDSNDRNRLIVTNGSADVYGQPIGGVTLSVNGVAVPWQLGASATTAGSVAIPEASRYTWKLTIHGSDPALSASTDGSDLVLGIRPRSAASPFNDPAHTLGADVRAFPFIAQQPFKEVSHVRPSPSRQTNRH